MLIAGFLRTETGDFDHPAFAMLIFMTFFGGYGLLILIPKALRERRVRFTNRGPYGFRGGEYIFEQDKTPVRFWIVIG